MANKNDLLERMTEKSGLTKKDSEKALNAFLESVKDLLSEGEKIQLVGFGSFEVRHRAARQGRNPKDPEQIIEIPASKAPAFKPGKALKEAVNK